LRWKEWARYKVSAAAESLRGLVDYVQTFNIIALLGMMVLVDVMSDSSSRKMHIYRFEVRRF
jgi:hypothetical protein